MESHLPGESLHPCPPQCLLTSFCHLSEVTAVSIAAPPGRRTAPAGGRRESLQGQCLPRWPKESIPMSSRIELSVQICFLLSYQEFSSNKVTPLFLKLLQGMHTGSFVFIMLLAVFKFLSVFLYPGGSARLLRPRLLFLCQQFLAGYSLF